VKTQNPRYTTIRDAAWPCGRDSEPRRVLLPRLGPTASALDADRACGRGKPVTDASMHWGCSVTGYYSILRMMGFDTGLGRNWGNGEKDKIAFTNDT